MHDQHIARAFDRDLESIQGMLIKMGGMVETAIVEGARSLEMRDVERAEQVRAADKQIDALEEQLTEEATRVIALRAPTASDLRTVMTAIKIGTNLERCGDYAKNMAKRTTVLAEVSAIEGAPASIRRMCHEVQMMLKDALDAYFQRDDKLAMKVILRDEDVDELYNALFRELLTHMMEDPRNITPCMHLHFIAKNVERMGDHVTSIAEQVIYLVTGAYPEESRPKQDKTSFIGRGA
ncbi:MAG: phosphate signaling complex protein PhoU [Silicimonas sp.]